MPVKKLIRIVRVSPALILAISIGLYVGISLGGPRSEVVTLPPSEVYNGPNFSFQIPEGWEFSPQGGVAVGKTQDLLFGENGKLQKGAYLEISIVPNKPLSYDFEGQKFSEESARKEEITFGGAKGQKYSFFDSASGADRVVISAQKDDKYLVISSFFDNKEKAKHQNSLAILLKDFKFL